MTKEELKQRLTMSINYDVSHANLARERFKESGDLHDLQDYSRHNYAAETTKIILNFVEELED